MGSDGIYTRAGGIFAVCVFVYGCSEYPPDFPKKQEQVAAGCPPVVTGPLLPRFTDQAPEFFLAGHALVESCNLERIDEKAIDQLPREVRVGRPLKVAGWVADTRSAGVPESVAIRAVAEESGAVYYAPIALSVLRGDVVTHLGGERAYLRSGFNVEVDIGELKPGAYKLQLAFLSKGRSALCDNGRKLAVTK